MVYTVVFSRGAKRSIDRLEEIEKRRIKGKVNELMTDPYKARKPLKGPFKVRNIWSSRIGNYRVLYTIFEDKRTVSVIRVDSLTRINHVKLLTHAIFLV